jgi:hypothetical protein
MQGTEAVARDIDTMSKAIEGDSTPINCTPVFWPYIFTASTECTMTIDAAVSYGTAIGQYLIQVLPPARIGRIILDSVLDANHWIDYSEVATHCGLASLIRQGMCSQLV